ncbi:MAG: HNH nuclease family protein [Nitrospirota bacterium]|nr:MAG: HNH nuclease family protein [Nitrospirota bacterium]
MRDKGIRIKSSRKGKSNRSVSDIVKDLKKANTPLNDYRDRSIAIHGLICAKCGKEFDHKSRHLLTVHHKDGNHNNNPQDGSNWENLCVYCHEDEHSRERLGDYLRGK